MLAKEEVKELKKEMKAKLVMINLFKQYREEAHQRVIAERQVFRDELFKEVGCDIHQTDSRYIASLSSEAGDRWDEESSALEVDSDVEEIGSFTQPSSPRRNTSRIPAH